MNLCWPWTNMNIIFLVSLASCSPNPSNTAPLTRWFTNPLVGLPNSLAVGDSHYHDLAPQCKMSPDDPPLPPHPDTQQIRKGTFCTTEMIKRGAGLWLKLVRRLHNIALYLKANIYVLYLTV